MSEEICGVRDKRFVSQENPEGICQRKPVENSKRCAMHGGKSTGPKTRNGKLKATLRKGTHYTFLLKCSICPPQLHCALYDGNQEYCPLERDILFEEVNVQAIREQRIKRLLIIIERCERIFAKKAGIQILGHIERSDSQLERYLNAYEKISPTKKAKSFVEKLAERRKEVEGISKEFVSRDISKAFVKTRIFKEIFEGHGWLRGAFNHERNVAFVYFDELVRWAFDTYPKPWAIDAIIRISSLTLLHELAHEDYPILRANHSRWSRFLAKNVWEYLR